MLGPDPSCLLKKSIGDGNKMIVKNRKKRKLRKINWVPVYNIVVLTYDQNHYHRKKKAM